MALAKEGSPLGRPPGIRPTTPLWSWVHDRFSRTDAVLMAISGLVALAIQWPHRPFFLNIWDSFLFANAANEYDLLGGYPHPPGYPVFVFVVNVFDVFTDAENALELVSMSFAALSVALLFGFLREFTSRPAAAVAAFVFALSPTLVYNGVMSLSYSAECAASIGVAWLAWRERQGPTVRRTVALAVVFGLCTGLRTTVFLYLFPLVAWSVWGRMGTTEERVRRMLVAAGAGAVSVVAWLTPMFIFGGSPATWLFTTRVQSSVVIFSNTVFTNGLDAVRDQGGRILVFLEPEVPVLVVSAAIFALWWRLARGVGAYEVARIFRFVLVWILPSILFFTFVFSGWERGPRGYALIFLPALYVALGVGLQSLVQPLLRSVFQPSRRAAVIATSLLVALSPIAFLQPERDALLESDVYARNSWGQGWLGLKDALPPNETAILTSHEWEFARWYFPEYVVWGYLPGTTHPDWTLAPWHFVLEARDRVDDVPLYGVYLAGAPMDEHEIPEGIQRIVLTDFSMAGEGADSRALLDDVDVKEMILPNGWRVLYFDVDPSRPTIESYLLP